MFEILGIAFKILLGIPTRYAGVCVCVGVLSRDHERICNCITFSF